MELNVGFAQELKTDFAIKWQNMAPSYVAKRDGIDCAVDPITEEYMKNLAWALYLDGVNKGLELGKNLAKNIQEKLGLQVG